MFLLGAVGWSRRRILLWYESEALLGGGFIALVGIGSCLFGPRTTWVLGLAGLGGCSLTLVLLGLDLADRRREFLILRAVGWSRRAQLALVLAERAGLGLVSAALASILASLMAGPVLGASGAMPAALAAAGAGSVVLWGAGWRPLGEPRG